MTRHAFIQRLLSVLLALFLVANCWIIIRRGFNNPGDLATFHRVATKFWAGQTNYYVDDDIAPPHSYPPSSVFFLAPMGLISFESIIKVWCCLNTIFYLLALWISVRLYQRYRSDSLRSLLGPVTFGVLLISASVHLDAGVNTLNHFIFLTMVLSVYLREKGQSIVPVLLIAMGISIKLLPGAVLIYFFLKKDWSMVRWISIVTFVFMVILPIASFGWTDTVRFFHEWIEIDLSHMAQGGGFLRSANQSPLAVFARWGITSDLSTLLWLLVNGMLVASVVRVLGNRDVPAAYALSVMLVVTLPSAAWTSYHFILFFAYMVIWDRILAGEIHPFFVGLWWIQIVVFHFTTELFFGQVMANQFREWGNHFVGTFLLMSILGFGRRKEFSPATPSRTLPVVANPGLLARARYKRGYEMASGTYDKNMTQLISRNDSKIEAD